MGWQGYERTVRGSREVIVFPFFENHLRGKQGVGLDVGCGHGDLTKRIASVIKGRLVGSTMTKKASGTLAARRSKTSTSLEAI